MAHEAVNPYQAPEPLPDAPERSGGRRSRKPDHHSGPAIYIASFALLGGIAGIPLLADADTFGFIGFAGVVLGALLGGMIYRIRSRKWPIDPAARSRRFGYALMVVVAIPGLIGSMAGLRAQGLGMTLIGLIVGAALAAGILISGDRRYVPPS